MKLLSHQLLNELATRAAGTPRKRANHNIHSGAEDPVQRFFVAAQRETYFRPHRHVTRSEMAYIVRGRFRVLTFADDGEVTGRFEVGEGTSSVGFETPAGTWHTLLSELDGSIFLEIKQGPYDPQISAEFASWAPPEEDPRKAAFLAWLRTAQPGSRAVATEGGYVTRLPRSEAAAG